MPEKPQKEFNPDIYPDEETARERDGRFSDGDDIDLEYITIEKEKPEED